MRSSVLRALGLGIVSLACATSLSFPASAATTPSPAAGGQGITGTDATCYSNTGNLDDYRTMSQNFAPILDAYDSAAADDITLTKTCTVTSIQVVGAYSAENAVDSETVTFYKDRNGKPGKVISSQTRVGIDNAGSFDIRLKPVTLTAGTYWVSVVANLNSESGGQWYWTNTNTQLGALAVWRNPGGAWVADEACKTWQVIEQCLGAGPGPDLAFSLTGK